MPRAFHIPGIIFIFCAFVLLFLVSVSLPYLTALDFVRVHFEGNSSTGAGDQAALNELRYGIWAYCWYDTAGTRSCSPSGHGYSTTVYNSDKTSWQTVGPSWTRGLAVHPVAAGTTLLALLFSFPTHTTFTLLASLTSFLSALLTLIAFAIDIALYAYVKSRMGRLEGVREGTSAGPAFWLTLVSFILLCLGGCTVCFGRRRDRMTGATSYPMVGKKTGWRARFQS